MLTKILRWINVLVILATLLAYLAPYVNPGKIWVFSVLALGYPVYLVLNIFFVVFWLIRRRWYFLYSLCCMLAGIGYLTGIFGFHFFKNEAAGENEIKVMTYNTAEFSPGIRKNTDKEPEFRKLRRMVEEMGRPDIFCAQEAKNAKTRDSIQAIFGFKNFYKNEGTVIFSKYPFVDKGKVDISANSCAWADLKTPGGIVRVYCVHLRSNQMTGTATRIATEGDLREKETWKDIRFVLARYKSAAKVRANQAQMLADHIAQSPYPIILCGDLNETPVSYTYRLLSHNLQDSFREKGAGLGATFAGKLPTLRIDYVFPDDRLRVKNHEIIKVELSDHFPVFVSLEWNRD